MGVSCGKPHLHAVQGVFPHTPPHLRDLVFLRTIGTGNYSHVHLCRFKDCPVAVKVMNKSHLHKRLQVEHIFAEKEVLHLLRSPFIVRLIGTCQDEVNLYCVLEYVPGGELFNLLVRKNTLAKQEARFYLAEVVQAIADLHVINCMYRDLKPENILLTASGHIKLADFGFAKLLINEERTFTLCGTPEYLAPELIDGSGCDLRLDWWQVGVLLYEMMSGKTPFMDPNPYRMYEKILTKEPDLTGNWCDEETKSLLSGLLTKLPNSRMTEKQILSHCFFHKTVWKSLLDADPPFHPSLSSSFDTCYFEHFPEVHSTEVLEAGSEQEFSEY